MKDARDRPRVFISYSHDSPQHKERVLGLSERLRADGIETSLDQYVPGTPTETWPRWMRDQLDWAQFVLVVCTETYYRRFRGHEVPGPGKGADWEGAIIAQALYDERSATTEFVPVLFDPHDVCFVPEPLRDRPFCLLTSAEAYQKLSVRLLGQPRRKSSGPLGPAQREPRKRDTPLSFGAGAPQDAAARDEAGPAGNYPPYDAASGPRRAGKGRRKSFGAGRKPPQEAAVGARPRSRGTPPLYWNTRFPEDPAVHDTRMLLARKTYVVETGIEPHAGQKDLDSAPAGMEKLFGPGEETIDVVFYVETEGLQVRPTGGSAGDFGAFVRSEPLPCSLRDGSRPFRVEVRGLSEGPATLLLSLLAKNAVVSRRRLEFRVATAPGSFFGGFRSARIPSPGPGPSLTLVSDRSPLFAAVTPAEIRIRISANEEGGRECQIEVEKDNRGPGPKDLKKEKSQLDALGSELRSRLDALSRSYDPDPAAAPEEFGLRLRAPEPVMLEFARIGAELCEKLFGNPDHPANVDLRKVVLPIATTPGGEGSRLQIDADYLPLPWALLYDARVHASALGAGDPEYARQHLRFHELTAEAVSPRFFWGYRFAIDRLLHVDLLSSTGKQGQIQAFIHPGILRQMRPPPGDKQAAFFDALRQTAGLLVDRKKTNSEFEAFLANQQMQSLDLLYLYCHAQRASSTSPRGTVLRGEEALKNACVLLDAPPDKLTLEQMWVKRDMPLPGAPLVFLNACASASGDPEFQSPFLDLFINTYGARGYVGTDWEVPAVFADAFARRVLHRYVVEDVPLGLAFHRTTREVLETYNNPFGLIYCLYAAPGLRFSQGG